MLRQIAYRVRRLLLGMLRWPTRGVKVLVFDPAGRVLLIRNSYGKLEQFVLPGGGIKRGETPEAAGAREVREETACRVRDVTLIATFVARGEGKRDTVFLCRGTTQDAPMADGREVIEAGFFACDALPAGTSPATRRRIAEVAEERATTDEW